MFEYLAVYNSSIKNDDTGDQKVDRDARVDIDSPDAHRYETVLMPVANDGSRGRQNVNSNRSFAVGNDTNTDDADSDKRIGTGLSGTKLQDQRVNDSSRLDHPASVMREDVDVGPAATGIKKSMQSPEMENTSEVEVDGKVEYKKANSDVPASRGFVLPYLVKSPSIGNSTSLSQPLERFSGDDRSQITDKKAMEENETEVPEASTKKFRSAD
jgi:hypothetical protein